MREFEYRCRVSSRPKGRRLAIRLVTLCFIASICLHEPISVKSRYKTVFTTYACDIRMMLFRQDYRVEFNRAVDQGNECFHVFFIRNGNNKLGIVININNKQLICYKQTKSVNNGLHRC